MIRVEKKDAEKGSISIEQGAQLHSRKGIFLEGRIRQKNRKGGDFFCSRGYLAPESIE